MPEIPEWILRVPGWSSEGCLVELRELAEIAIKYGATHLVEVGSWEGRSTLALAEVAARHGLIKGVISIDHYPTGPEYEEYDHIQTMADPGDGDREELLEVDSWLDKTNPKAPHEPRTRLIARLHIYNLYPYVEAFPEPSWKAAYKLAANPRLHGYDGVREDFKVGLVFIDAAHTMGDCWRDLQLYAPLVMPGGYLMVHDKHSAPLDVAHDANIWYDWNLDSWRELNRQEEMYIFQKVR